MRLLFGVGMGLVMAPATESIMGSLPKAKAGVGSAVNDTTRQTGGALGVAIIGSVFAATLPPRDRRCPPACPPPPTRWCTTRSARPLDAVTRSAFRVDLARAVHDAASDAFFRGMQVAAWVGTAVVICAAIVAYRYLPARADRPCAPTTSWTRTPAWPPRSTTAC